ncbi:MAG: hypothetical protein DRQ45_04560 [Gammaproteobacteria bacterium]|nr:MAG: hypothetical protein DRQ45_04560 [Gammaproteobacteria bacterium]
MALLVMECFLGFASILVVYLAAIFMMQLDLNIWVTFLVLLAVAFLTSILWVITLDAIMNHAS